MPHRRVLIVLIAVAVFSLSRSTNLKAYDQYGWVHGHYRGPTPYYIGNPKSMDIAKTTSPGVAVKTNRSSPPGQVESSPRAYPYGYFGAQYRPYTVLHRNYYNDYTQTSLRWGY